MLTTPEKNYQQNYSQLHHITILSTFVWSCNLAHGLVKICGGCKKTIKAMRAFATQRATNPIAKAKCAPKTKKTCQKNATWGGGDARLFSSSSLFFFLSCVSSCFCF